MEKLVKFLLLAFILQLVTGCASSTIARSFIPTNQIIETEDYIVELTSGYEITDSWTVFLYVPTGYSEKHERKPVRTVHVEITPKNPNIEIDLYKIRISEESIGTIFPVSVREYNGQPRRHTLIDTMDKSLMPVKIGEKVRNFSLDFNLEGVNIGDSILLEIGGDLSPHSKISNETVKFEESTINFHRQ